MSMQEAGKAANTFLDIMRTQPLSLALVVMNIVLLVILYSIYTKSVENRETEMGMIFKHQAEVQNLLARCVVPDRT